MKDLFGNEIGTPEKQPKKKANHSAMVAHHNLIRLHGEVKGEKCKTCENLIYYQHGNKYFKCKLFSTSGSPSTDWRSGWAACGKFKQEEDENVNNTTVDPAL